MATFDFPGFGEERCRVERARLVSYLYALSRDYHLAEDMAQETLIIGYRKRKHYFPEADFGAWLRAIARNVWMRSQKRALQRRALEEGALQHREAAPLKRAFLTDEFADDLFPAKLYSGKSWAREKEALADCMELLEATDRTLIREHFASGTRYAVLARRARRTVSWVKVRMFRARNALGDCIRRKLAGA